MNHTPIPSTGQSSYCAHHRALLRGGGRPTGAPTESVHGGARHGRGGRRENDTVLRHSRRQRVSTTRQRRRPAHRTCATDARTTAFNRCSPADRHRSRARPWRGLRCVGRPQPGRAPRVPTSRLASSPSSAPGAGTSPGAERTVDAPGCGSCARALGGHAAACSHARRVMHQRACPRVDLGLPQASTHSGATCTDFDPTACLPHPCLG